MQVQSLAEKDERSSATLIEAAQRVFKEEPAVKVDYVEIVDTETLDPVADVSRGALVALAAFVGKTRLIDNILLPG
jgi:pantoate--beta-alanine ligase